MTEVNGEKIVHACAWCFPGSSLVATFPAFSGLKVSHGICPTHKAEQMKELDAMAFLSRPVGK